MKQRICFHFIHAPDASKLYYSANVKWPSVVYLVLRALVIMTEIPHYLSDATPCRSIFLIYFCFSK